MESIYIERDRLQSFYNKLDKMQKDIYRNLEEASKPLRVTQWNDNVYALCKERLNAHIKSINDLFDQIETAKELIQNTLIRFDEYIEESKKELDFKSSGERSFLGIF